MKKTTSDSSSSHQHFYLFSILIGIALLLVVIVAQLNQIELALSTQSQPSGVAGANAANPTPQANPALAVAGSNTNISIGTSPVLGKAEAKVTIFEFSDFECPFCVRFNNDTMRQIKKNYVDTGAVKIVFKQFPLSFHPQAQKAAEASLCARKQGKFWDMHDLLFDKGVQGGVTTFKKYAADLKLDTAKFNDCLDNGETASLVKKDQADGSAAGVTGTPSFVINGKLIVGAQPYAAFKTAIDAAVLAAK